MAEKEQDFMIGCPNPYSVAEAIAGKSINWTKKKDVFDTMAECYGITKEGYLSDDSPLQAPFTGVDENGNLCQLSEEEAEKRLVSFLEKHARPEKRTRRKMPLEATTADTESEKSGGATKPQELTQAEKRQRAVSILLMKGEAKKPKAESGKAVKTARAKSVPQAAEVLFDVKCDGIEAVESDDGPHTPAGMEWRDRGYFFNETALWSDVNQNGIGDCYFLAALCSVAYVNPFFIQNKTGLRFKWTNTEKRTGNIEEETPWHVVDFYVPKNTGEAAQAWKDKKGLVQHMVVSEEILVSSSTGYNYGACGAKERALRTQGKRITGTKASWDSCWAAVYEKAYAKFLERTSSDYPNMFSGTAADDRNGIVSGLIRGGVSEDALKEILQTEQVEAKSLSSLTTDKIWELAGKAKTHPTCCSIYKTAKVENGKTVYYGKAGTEAQYRDMGLYIGHAYSLLGCITFDNKKYIVIRNPHGSNLPTMKNNSKIYQKNWGYSFGAPIDGGFHNWYSVYRYLNGTADPLTSRGLFLMEVDEFKRVFTTIEYYTGSTFENYL